MGDKQVSHKFTTNNHTSFIRSLIIEHINCANLLKKKMYPGNNDVGDNRQQEIRISTRNETIRVPVGIKQASYLEIYQPFLGWKCFSFETVHC